MKEIKIGDRWVGSNHPCYFIADISANHDGNLERAKMLIRLAAEAGADAAKFQNFRAPKIVSDFGFKTMGSQVSHQASWTKSVYEVYAEASIPFEWTPELRAVCDEVGIHYFSSPYDFDAVDMLEPYVPAYKIGSGDITWLEIIEYIANKGKPVVLATGASTIGDVQRAVDAVLDINRELVLMQCNTNYTASLKNFDYIHLNVLKTYALLYPDVVLGLSDHTLGHATVLGAVALGAKAVEKHFTDDTTRQGPDHPFSLDPASWKDMVDRTRELERALGSANKRVEDNESHTVIVQQRCLRAGRDIEAGEVFSRDMIEVLRPAPSDAIRPYEIGAVIGLHALVDIPLGEALLWSMLGAK
ncbi:MAG: N-acetylneuraminate synthase [Chloroflexi bacterium RBG_16_48_8]|nr:MAG: N-acetylneuraminate synthase [Chloroflexi bacterium RBG_16_48_8]